MVILLATITLGLVNKTKAQGYGGISFNTFYQELSPYGSWVYDARYGQVWIADAPGFEPYYDNGRWVYTSYGWTWASDYAWGWAPFHYGRWTYLPTWGWAWVPGYEWGPAWVGWCQNDGYYGWAPLSPGMGYNFSYNSVPHNYWRFVQQQYITGPSIRNHIIRPERNRNQFSNVTIINNTQVNNNITYATGPQREAVEKITRQKINTRPVAFTSKDERTRVEKQEVRMYRPDLKPNNGAAGNNQRTDLQQDKIQQGQPVNGAIKTGGVKPLPTNTTAPANTAQPVTRNNDRRIKPLPSNTQQDAATAMEEPVVNRRTEQQPMVRPPLQKENELQQNTQRQNDMRQQRVKEQLMKEQQMKTQREQQQSQQQNEQLRQNELKQQQAQQHEQLRLQQLQEQKLQQQRALQQQNEQRQNEIRQQREQQQRDLQLQNQQRQDEIRQQQVREQRAEQQRMLLQQNRQQQNEIRQQRIQEAPVRQQRNTPMNQKPRSGKPNEN